MIKVKLVGGLAEKFGKKEFELEYRRGMRVRDIVSILSRKYPPLAEKFEKGEIIASVNYKYARGDLELKEGDLLILMPEIFGG